MNLLHFLVLFGDLGIYYAFAVYFASCFGGGWHLLPLLGAAACYGAASRFRSRPLACRLWALPIFLGFLLLRAPADRAAFLPAALYTCYRIWGRRYELSHDRQAELFLGFCRFYPGFFFFFAAVWDWQKMLEFSLPAALLGSAAQVLLLRILRLESGIRSLRSCFIHNSWLLAVLLGCAALLTINTGRIQQAAGTAYAVLLLPLLTVLSRCAAFFAERLLFPIVKLCVAFLCWLEALGAPEGSELSGNSAGGLQPLQGTAAASEVPWLMTAAKILLGLVLAGSALLFFWYLARRRTPWAEKTENSGEWRQRSPARRPPEPGHTAAARVRRVYRRYLRLRVKCGFTLKPWNTSLDLERTALDQQAEAELRSLYLRARYDGAASLQDAVRAEQLLRQIQHSSQKTDQI